MWPFICVTTAVFTSVQCSLLLWYCEEETKQKICEIMQEVAKFAEMSGCVVDSARDTWLRDALCAHPDKGENFLRFLLTVILKLCLK